MRMLSRKAFLIPLFLVLAACSVGPDYVRPTVEVPTSYKEAGKWKVAQPQDHLTRGKWWEAFGDSDLNALEEQLQITNQNLRVAEAQFRQAQALVQGVRAGYFPTVSANASSTRSESRAGTRTGGAVNADSVSLNAVWEADLWGRIRRQVEAGEATVQASGADLESARLSAQASLAQNYFLLRVADAQKQLLDDAVTAYERSLQIAQNRYATGVAPKAEVVQAETQLKSTQALAVDIGVQRAQLEHAIATLIGKAPSSFAIEPKPLVPTLPAVPLGLPSTLLERRPDIASAERRVAAANAQIGVAKSAFFPTFTLSASGGYASSTLANWFSLPNRFWSVGAALAQNLFDGGLRRAQSAQAIAAYDASVATYRQTVLAGFQEVEDNLAALRILEEEAKVQDAAVSASQQSVTLTLNQYKAGTVSYVNVVTVQAAMLTNQRAAVDVVGRRLTASVLLIKATGGGWSAFELSNPQAQPVSAPAQSPSAESANAPAHQVPSPMDKTP